MKGKVEGGTKKKDRKKRKKKKKKDYTMSWKTDRTPKRNRNSSSTDEVMTDGKFCGELKRSRL